MSGVLNRVRDGHTYAGNTDLVVMTCPACGVTYAIPRVLQQAAQEAGDRKITWCCPNGHDLGYNGPSEAAERAERAEADRDWYRQRHQAERDLREHTEHRLRAQKAATTRAKKRHAAGVCPCCNRSFVQLKRHMATQHSDYLAEHGLPADDGRQETA